MGYQREPDPGAKAIEDENARRGASERGQTWNKPWKTETWAEAIARIGTKAKEPRRELLGENPLNPHL